MHEMEQEVHGRSRHLTRTKNGNDEPHFGVLHEPVRLVRGNLQSLFSPDNNPDNSNSAQWTGCVTAIAASMLQTNMVDTVVCIATNNEGDWTQPDPILARSVKDVMRGRGVKPALAPSLKVLDAIRTDPSIRRLLFCGVGCAVQGRIYF
jgi:coenzyme F420 hydrogenase subunit beta/7-hydroxymethyl chlorophyll a reductase